MITAAAMLYELSSSKWMGGQFLLDVHVEKSILAQMAEAAAKAAEMMRIKWLVLYAQLYFWTLS